MAINNKEKQEEQQRQSLNRALLSVPGISMLVPELFARRMSRDEQRARLLSTLQSALDITSDVDVSFFENPV
jgi:hypothetical protein